MLASRTLSTSLSTVVCHAGDANDAAAATAAALVLLRGCGGVGVRLGVGARTGFCWWRYKVRVSIRQRVWGELSHTARLLHTYSVGGEEPPSLCNVVA